MPQVDPNEDPLRHKDALDPNHPLMIAARENDADADRTPLGQICEQLGLDLAAAMYVAEQRAIRAALIAHGRTDIIDLMNSTSASTPFAPTPSMQAMMIRLIPVYLDGIVIGWKGRTLADLTPSQHTAVVSVIDQVKADAVGGLRDSDEYAIDICEALKDG